MAEKIEFDFSDIKDGVKSFLDELSRLGKKSDEVYSTMSQDIEEATAAMKDMQAAQEEVNADMKKQEAAVGGLASKIKAYIKDTQIAGKSVSEWGQQLGGAYSKLVQAAQGSGILSGAMRGIGLAIKISGIGLLLGVVGSLIVYFKRFQDGIDLVNRVMESGKAVVTVLVDRFLKLGSAIYNIITLNFSAAAQDMSSAVSGLGSELVNAATAAYSLEKRFQDLNNAARTASAENARLRVQLDALKRIADDDTQSIQKRNAARLAAAKIEQKIASEGVDRALEAKKIAEGKFALDSNTAANRDALAQAEIDFQNAINENNNIIFENEKKGRELQIAQREKSAKALKDESDALEKLRKDLEKLRVETQPEGIDQELAAVEKKFNDLQKLTIDGVAKLNEIEKRRGLTSKEQAERQEFVDLAQKLEERRLEALSDVLVKFADKDIEIEAAQAKAKEDIRKKDFEAAKKSIENVKKLQDSEIDITEENFKNFISILGANGTDKAKIEEAQFNFDNIIKEKRLQTEIEFQEGLLALIGDGDANQTALIKNQIAKLKAQLDGLSIGPAAKETPKKKSAQTLADLFGIDDEFKDLFNKSISQLEEGLNRLTDARVEAAQAAVKAADDEIDAAERKVDKAQEALDREIEIAQLGFASDVDLRNQQLAQAEAQEALAKAQREKALAEQKKAQKLQLVSDATAQASNIAVSVSNLIKSWSTLPFGLGLLAAFAQAASIIALFGGIKAKSRAIAAQAKHGITGEIGEKGIVAGPSHDNGGVPLEVEGGEFVYQDGKRISVVKKSATKTHFDLLQAINRDDRPSMLRYVEKLTGGISRATDGSQSAGVGTSDKETHRLLAENNRLQKKMVEMKEDELKYIDMGSYVLVKGKNKEFKMKKG